jgi:putative addiction module killer protein
MVCRASRHSSEGANRRPVAASLGDAKPVGGSVAELRIDYGPGYRIYYVRRGDTVVILLTGGDKSRQSADIAKARALAAELE